MWVQVLLPAGEICSKGYSSRVALKRKGMGGRKKKGEARLGIFKY